MISTCPKCGSPLRPGARYCPRCQFDLSQAGPPGARPAVPPPPAAPAGAGYTPQPPPPGGPPYAAPPPPSTPPYAQQPPPPAGQPPGYGQAPPGGYAPPPPGMYGPAPVPAATPAPPPRAGGFRATLRRILPGIAMLALGLLLGLLLGMVIWKGSGKEEATPTETPVPATATPAAGAAAPTAAEPTTVSAAPTATPMGSPAPPPAEANTPAPPTAAPSVAEGSPAPDFTLAELDGADHTLSSEQGKVVVLTFWKLGDDPSKEALQGLQELKKEFSGDDRLVILGVNSQGDPVEVRKLRDELGLTYTILLDTDGAQAAIYKADPPPLTYIIGKAGMIRRAIPGKLEDTHKEFIRGLLGE